MNFSIGGSEIFHVINGLNDSNVFLRAQQNWIFTRRLWGFASIWGSHVDDLSSYRRLKALSQDLRVDVPILQSCYGKMIVEPVPFFTLLDKGNEQLDQHQHQL